MNGERHSGVMQEPPRNHCEDGGLKPPTATKVMLRRTSVIMLFIAVGLSGCVSAPEKLTVDDTIIFAGVVQNIHMLGEKREAVIICDFNPGFVVSVQTGRVIRNLAIHSPTRTFMGRDPVGKNYKFELSRFDSMLQLRKVEEVSP